MKMELKQKESISSDAASRILGLSRRVPLTHETMASGLRATYFPYGKSSGKVAAFAERLREAMEDHGVEIMPFDKALAEGRRGKVGEGIVIIAPGEMENGALPVDFVSSLRANTVVGIEDGPCPADAIRDQQRRLNTIVESLAWNIVQAVIYVDDPVWTICTMNGAIIPCEGGEGFSRDVYATLIPKLAAPVVPPHASDFIVEEGGLDLRAAEWEPYVRDFETSSPLWAETGLMLFHTSLSALEFRTTYYKRVAAAYLDKRSGMSYGFLTRQPATVCAPALLDREAEELEGWKDWSDSGYGVVNGQRYAVVRFSGHVFAVKVPDIAMLATRSGCDKSHIDGHKDLVLLGMRDGMIFLKTPKGLDAAIDARPSYDTLTILAHGIANAMIGAILKRLAPSAEFVRILTQNGLALAHWHGTLDTAVIPKNYIIFGDDKPPVSCSTHQAAIYTLTGKIEAFTRQMQQSGEYAGDVHIEPHHGINVTWPSLMGLAGAILSHGVEEESRPKRAIA